MNLRELMNMTSTELTLLGLGDKAVEPIVRAYLLEAEKKAAALLGIDDGIDDEVSISVVSGDPDVSIPSWVLKIKYVELDGKELDVVNDTDRRALAVRDDSTPSLLVLGEIPNIARIRGAPTQDGTLVCKVIRGLRTAMSQDSDSPLDISEESHSGLCDWVVYRLSGEQSRLGRFSSMIDYERRRAAKRRSKPARLIAYGGL